MKKNIFQILIIFIVYLTLFSYVSAAELILDPSRKSVGIGEQFYVDLMLDTKGAEINGIEGGLNFSNNLLSFIRAEYGKSVFDMWVVSPRLNKKLIEFTGVISSGFAGVIDPFRGLDYKMPGLVSRLVFEGRSPGEAKLSLNPTMLALNDGLGSLIEVSSKDLIINVIDVYRDTKYNTEEQSTPTINYEIIRDENLYDNKHTLVFDARDSISGIKEVLIKEGNRDWKKIESPYVLEDQSRRSIIILQFSNFSGETVVKKIDPLNTSWFNGANITLSILLLFIFIILLRYYYFKFKKHV